MVRNIKAEQEKLKRMNFPSEYWDLSKDKIPKSLLPAFDKYIKQKDKYIDEGFGFIIYGPPGIGKTGACIFLARLLNVNYSKSRNGFYTSYYIRASDFRDKTRSKEVFENDVTVVDRCKNVDFLILDDISEKEATQAWPSSDIFTDLLLHRSTNGKSTFMTTNLTRLKLVELFPDLAKAVLGHMAHIIADGPNLRLERQKEIDKEFSI